MSNSQNKNDKFNKSPNSGKSQSSKSGKSNGRKHRGKPDSVPDLTGSVAGEVSGASEVTSNSQPSTKNDISWHVKDSRWLEAAARIGYGLPLGAKINYGPGGGAIANNSSIPGIMTFIFTPTYGLANGENSELNNAMINMFNKVRSRISGKRDYERTDLMKYVLAIDSLYMFYGFVARAYKSLNLSSYRNYYLGKALFEAQGLDFEDFVKHRMEFYGFLREMRMTLEQFALPKAIDMYARHKWMVDNIWKDTNTDFAQMYLFLPRTFYRWYDVYDSSTRPGIAPILIPWIDDPDHGLGTLEDLWNMYSELTNPLRRNGDIAQMSADVVSVFGDAIWIPDDFTLDEFVTIAYDEEALIQIHNATMLGDFIVDPGTPVIFEDFDVPVKHGYLLSNFRFLQPYGGMPNTEASGIPGSSAFINNKILDFTDWVTSTQGTMYATRLAAMPSSVNSDGYYEWDTMATEVINYARIHYFSCSNYADRVVNDEIIQVDTYDMRHYETERIFTNMLAFDALKTDDMDGYPSNITCTYGTLEPEWRTSDHQYHGTPNWTLHVSDSNDLNNPLTNTGIVKGKRVLSAIQTMLSVFNWHPPVSFTSATAFYRKGIFKGYLYSPFVGYVQDVDVFGVITADEMRAMNKLDVSSEFDVLR